MTYTKVSNATTAMNIKMIANAKNPNFTKPTNQTSTISMTV
jgi:hypothetical protein